MTQQVPEKVATPASPAAKLFAEFVTRRRADPSVQLDAICRAHPEHARELRMLGAHWERVLEVLAHLGGPSSLASGPAGEGAAAPPTEGAAADAPGIASEILRRLAGRKRASSRYDMRGEVARGGMGAILRVWDEDLRRNLAMKVVLGQAGQSSAGTPPVETALLARFLEEAQITSQLEHPGIVPVHELGLDADGRVYFTMRLVSGRDLEHIFGLVRAEEEGWTQTRAVGVMLKICEAMAYAHDKRVIHRDLKPANVMVGRFGEVYVMDWGLARVLGREETHRITARRSDPPSSTSVSTDRLDLRQAASSSPMYTMDGDVVGTPAYMSPEQARGDLAAMGPASDVYSTGAILYHLLAGHMPYAPAGTEPTVVEIWQMARAGSPPPLHELAPEAPAELVAICEKAMAREVDERYASMLELAEDLRAYLEGRVVRAYETGAVAEFRKWVARNKGLAVTVLSAVFVILGGTTTASFVLADKNEKLRDANLASQRSESKALDNERVAKQNAAIAEDRATRILRLSDVKRLQELTKRAETLWPAHPEQVDALEAWLREARELVSRLPDHRAALGELRERALPREGVAPQSSPAEAGGPWKFASAEDRWQHDTQAELVDGLEAFSSPEHGRVADVERRLSFARTIESRSISGAEPRALWQQAVASIADRSACPKYAGLVLAPQLGLVPLGQDRASGLWEFAHLQTGEAPRRDPDTGELELDEQSGIVFVLIPGGSFEMGAQKDDSDAPNFDPEAQEDEGPVLPISLDPFLLSKYELTQGQWLRAAGSNPSIYGEGTLFAGVRTSLLHPVEQVSWTDCEDLLRRLALELPTEAQWEYAARAGTSTPWWTGEDKFTLEGACNIADRAAKRGGAKWPGLDDWPELDDGFAIHAPCNRFRPNAFGLHNVHGNVWEWCRDDYGRYDLEVSPGDGLRLRASPAFRVSRGGSFFHPATHSRSANRNNSAPDTRSNHLGLRPARKLAPR